MNLLSANGTYVVRFVVKHFDNSVSSMDILYAVNAKKEPVATKSPRLAENTLSVTGSTISVSELLDIVNQYFPDILPEEALKHYGHDARPCQWGRFLLTLFVGIPKVSIRTVPIDTFPFLFSKAHVPFLL